MNLLDPSLWWVFALIAIFALLGVIIVKKLYHITIGEKADLPEVYPEGIWIPFSRKRKRD